MSDFTPGPKRSEQELLNAAFDEANRAFKTTTEGGTASGSPSTENPTQIGLDAQDPNSMPADVDAGDAVYARGDLKGRTITYEATNRDATNDQIGTEGISKSHAISSGLASSLQVKTSSGKLWKVTVYNSSASAQNIQRYDNSSLPADSTVPDMNYPIPADNAFDLYFEHGLDFTNGMFLSNSSTDTTKTIGSADCFMEAWYE